MIAGVCAHVDVFRTLVPPATLFTVDERMLIIGPVHTLESTAYTKPGTAASPCSACMRIPLGLRRPHHAIDLPMNPECASAGFYY
jgi:hypothetical protein